VVLHSKGRCIGCSNCFYGCPFGAPQYPKVGNFGSRGKIIAEIYTERVYRCGYGSGA
jgi:Fe-S-cluster-containing dehydrogenase component